MPLGLMSLAAFVRESRPGFRIEILDRTVDRSLNIASIADRVADQGIGIVGISALTCTAQEAATIARMVKLRSPGTFVVVGGPHPSSDPESALREPAIDFGIAGEGEIPFDQLLGSLVGGGEPADVPGVLVRRDGTVSQKARGAFVSDLDQLPPPAFDLVDPRIYWKHQGFTLLGRRPYLPLFTSRGCPYKCIYCHQIFGNRFRARTPESVLSDMESLADRYGVREFEILDDSFNIKEARALDILENVQKRLPGTRILFPNGLRSDTLSASFIDTMSRAGVTYVSFAVESASPRIQSLIRKKLDVDKVKENIQHASRRGIFCNGYFMLG